MGRNIEGPPDHVEHSREEWRELTPSQRTYYRYDKKNREARKKWVRQKKQETGCVDCGEDHPACLDFHHTDPSEKEFDVTNYNRTLPSIKREVEKCVVLCSNCHRKRHFEE